MARAGLARRPRTIAAQADFRRDDWKSECKTSLAVRHVQAASFWQMRQSVCASTFGRWCRYANHLGPHFAALGIEPAKA